MIRSSLRFLGCVSINFTESWVALSFIGLWNHSSYGYAVSAAGIKRPSFSCKPWHKATFCEGNGRQRTWNMKCMCRSWWLWKWWTKSTVSRPKVCSLPLWSLGEALGVASRQAAALRCLGFQKWLLSSSNAQFPFLFLLQQTQALHHRWSCGGLVAPPQADIIAFTSPFWLVQGFGLGWRKACVRCYMNLSLSEWLFLSALALDLPFTGRVVVG